MVKDFMQNGMVSARERTCGKCGRGLWFAIKPVLKVWSQSLASPGL